MKESIYAITDNKPAWTAEKINSPIETIVKLAGYEYKCESLEKIDITEIIDIIKSTKSPDGISINMAKNQYLALNIQKLSGHCGKLICCLKYEDEAYLEIKKTLYY